MFYIRSNLRTFWGSSITYISLIGLFFFYQIYRKTHAIFARNTAINIKHLDLAWKWKTKHFEPEKGSVYVWHPPDRLLSSDRPHGGATWQNSNRRTCRVVSTRCCDTSTLPPNLMVNRRERVFCIKSANVSNGIQWFVFIFLFHNLFI